MKLSKDEVQSLVIEYLNHKQNKETNKILFKKIESNFFNQISYLIDMHTYKYKRFSNYEDIRQDCFESLLLGMKSFDPKKGSFVGWATYYVRTEAKRQANKHSVFHVPMEEAKDTPPIKVVYDGIMESFPETKDSPEMKVVKKDFKEKINYSLNKLSNLEKEIFQHYFHVENNVERKTVAQLCGTLKIPQSAYKVYLKNAAKKVEFDLSLKHSELTKSIYE